MKYVVRFSLLSVLVCRRAGLRQGHPDRAERLDPDDPRQSRARSRLTGRSTITVVGPQAERQPAEPGDRDPALGEHGDDRLGRDHDRDGGVSRPPCGATGAPAIATVTATTGDGDAAAMRRPGRGRRPDDQAGGSWIRSDPEQHPGRRHDARSPSIARNADGSSARGGHAGDPDHHPRERLNLAARTGDPQGRPPRPRP